MTATDTTNDTIEIRAIRFAEAEARVAKLAKRADKLGIDHDIRIEVIERVIREELLNPSTVIKRAYVICRVHGLAPKHDGWALRGRLDFTMSSTTPIRAMVPGFELPAEFHSVECTRCDACGVARQRNDVFVLEHEDGRMAIVGRSCLKDYLGHMTPAEAALRSDCMAFFQSDEYEQGGSRIPEYYDTHEVLTLAAFSIRDLGWASSKEDYSTRTDVENLIYPPMGAEAMREWQKRIAKVNDSDSKRAANCLEWMKSAPGSSDYIYNLRTLAGETSVPVKAFGLLVSAIVAYDRAMERETARRERASSAADSKHVGTIKTRLEMTLTVDMIRYWDTDYGTTTFIKMHDEDGNVLTWKASNSPEVYRGDVLRIKGTVKAHDDYKGTAQTVLTRCKILEVVEPGADREAA